MQFNKEDQRQQLESLLESAGADLVEAERRVQELENSMPTHPIDLEWYWIALEEARILVSGTKHYIDYINARISLLGR